MLKLNSSNGHTLHRLFLVCSLEAVLGPPFSLHNRILPHLEMGGLAIMKTEIELHVLGCHYTIKPQKRSGSPPRVMTVIKTAVLITLS